MVLQQAACEHKGRGFNEIWHHGCRPNNQGRMELWSHSVLAPLHKETRELGCSVRGSPRTTQPGKELSEMSLDNELELAFDRYTRVLAAGLLAKRVRISFREAVSYVAKEMIKRQPYF